MGQAKNLVEGLIPLARAQLEATKWRGADAAADRAGLCLCAECGHRFPLPAVAVCPSCSSSQVRRAVLDHEAQVLALRSALEMARARIEFWAGFAPRYERAEHLDAHLEAIDAVLGRVAT